MPMMCIDRCCLRGPSSLARLKIIGAALTTASWLSGTSFGQSRCLEISQDGRESVNACAEHAPGTTGGIAGASAIPYAAAPDWVNTLQRQVGDLQLADMNGDGWLDLVVGCFHNSDTYTDWRNFIHYNTGGQLETNPSWFSADQVHTSDLQIANLNKDGFPDIFAANGGFGHQPSVIYFGTATGPNSAPGWTAATPVSTWALAAAAFDFDHDGDTDIVTTNQSGIPNDNFRPLYMFRNNAGVVENTPSWQSQDTMISNGIDVGDYDNDGWEDIAVAKWVNFQCGIYKNNSGTLSALPVWTNGIIEGGRGADFYDLNGDGLLDVMFGLDPARLYQNNGGNTFTHTWTSTAPFPSAQENQWQDVDGDGDKDFAEIHFSTGRCHIYQNGDGALDTAPTWTYDAPNVGNALAFGDINGDTYPDLVIGYSGLPSIRVFYNAGPACAADIAPAPGGDDVVDVNDLLLVIGNWGATGANVADVNGDQVVDVNDLRAVVGAWGPCL